MSIPAWQQEERALDAITLELRTQALQRVSDKLTQLRALLQEVADCQVSYGCVMVPKELVERIEKALEPWEQVAIK